MSNGENKSKNNEHKLIKFGRETPVPNNSLKQKVVVKPTNKK